jgi:hypothetical protein
MTEDGFWLFGYGYVPTSLAYFAGNLRDPSMPNHYTYHQPTANEYYIVKLTFSAA